MSSCQVFLRTSLFCYGFCCWIKHCCFSYKSRKLFFGVLLSFIASFKSCGYNFLICDQNLKFTRNTFQLLSFNGLFFQTPAMVIVACLHNFLLLLKSYTFPVLSHVLFLCVAAASLRSVNRSPIFFTWCCSTVYFNFEIFQEKHSYFGP